jgi:hypothetical protein
MKQSLCQESNALSSLLEEQRRQDERIEKSTAGHAVRMLTALRLHSSGILSPTSAKL